jgi:hypothetical protein
MIEKIGSYYRAECDFCSNDVDINETEFMSTIDQLKKRGWKVFLSSGSWNHKCDFCMNGDSDDFDIFD